MNESYRHKGYVDPEEEKMIKSKKIPFNWEKFFRYTFPNIVVGIVMTTLLTGIVVGFAVMLTTEDKVSYCFIESRVVSVRVFETSYRSVLKGHRAWRNDVELGMFESPEKAKAFAQEIECPLYKK